MTDTRDWYKTGTAVDFTGPHIWDVQSEWEDRESYERDLKRRQDEHLRNVRGAHDMNWQACLHDSCPQCVGTGVKIDGSACIHCLSCPCPKCSPRC